MLVHEYGPHIFHTNSEKVVEYLSQFTEWRPYEHRVLARVDDQLVPMPINRTTINGSTAWAGRRGAGRASSSPSAPSRWTTSGPARTWWSRRSAASSTRSSSAATRASNGSATRPSCTPRSAPASRSAPTPTIATSRTSFQNMPADGYTAMFERILDHPLIEVSSRPTTTTSRTRSSTITSSGPGPIDALLRLSLRRPALPLAGVRAAQRADARRRLPAAGGVDQRAERGGPVHAHDRVPLADRAGSTTRRRWRSSSRAPRAIPTTRSRATTRGRSTGATRRSRAELPDVTFVGRLARYQYLNMDQVVGQALSAAEKLIARLDAESLVRSPSVGRGVRSG